MAASIDVSDSPHGYCTPKLNSLDCAPAMGFAEMPRTSLSSGFVVDCVNSRNDKSGRIS